jgi:putative FmdB family regulatory protein
MPTYEYACTSCGQHIEVVQSMSAAPLTECANCGGKLRKVFSPIGIVFKGSGFYKTDSRSSSNGRKSGSATKSDGESKTSSSDSGSGSDSPKKDSTAPKSDSGSSSSGGSTSSGSSGSPARSA